MIIASKYQKPCIFCVLYIVIIRSCILYVIVWILCVRREGRTKKKIGYSDIPPPTISAQGLPPTMLWSCNTYSYSKQLYSSITTYIVIPYENVSDVTSAATIWFSRSNLLKLFLDNVHCTFRATLDTSLSSPPLRPLQISQQCIFMLFYTYKKLGLAYVGFLFLLHSQ